MLRRPATTSSTVRRKVTRYADPPSSTLTTSPLTHSHSSLLPPVSTAPARLHQRQSQRQVRVSAPLARLK